MLLKQAQESVRGVTRAMNNNDVTESHKPFHAIGDSVSSSINVQDEIHNPKPFEVETLPSVVTNCLAPCQICVGKYVDITHRFVLKCCCQCHNGNTDKNGEEELP
jgi:hypothetical protein